MGFFLAAIVPDLSFLIANFLGGCSPLDIRCLSFRYSAFLDRRSNRCNRCCRSIRWAWRGGDTRVARQRAGSGWWAPVQSRSCRPCRALAQGARQPASETAAGRTVEKRERIGGWWARVARQSAALTVCGECRTPVVASFLRPFIGPRVETGRSRPSRTGSTRRRWDSSARPGGDAPALAHDDPQDDVRARTGREGQLGLRNRRSRRRGHTPQLPGSSSRRDLATTHNIR